MEPRKYSTGTKGRIKMHSDRCKEFIQANSPGFSLANEFIESIDPHRDENVWQRFPTPEDILPELQEWLGVETPAPAAPARPLPAAIPRHLPVQPASEIVRSPEDAALLRARTWFASAPGLAELEKLSPAEAAEAALGRFYKELTGREG